MKTETGIHLISETPCVRKHWSLGEIDMLQGVQRRNLSWVRAFCNYMKHPNKDMRQQNTPCHAEDKCPSVKPSLVGKAKYMVSLKGSEIHQGYHQLSGRLSVTNTWGIAFVQPKGNWEPKETNIQKYGTGFKTTVNCYLPGSSLALGNNLDTSSKEIFNQVIWRSSKHSKWQRSKKQSWSFSSSWYAPRQSQGTLGLLSTTRWEHPICSSSASAPCGGSSFT